MFHDPEQFVFARELRARWSIIRQEYLELDAPILELHRAGDAELYAETLLKENGWTPSWQVDETEPNQAWLTYALSYKGRQPNDLARRMPATSRLLARLQGFHVAALSVMRGGSFIAPHSHPELKDRLLTLHLGLDVVPQRSFLCVESDVREQRAGHVLIFDGSRQHFAINMSKTNRAVLYIEFYPDAVAFAAA